MENVILVIDDDEMNLKVAKVILERKLSCKVICVDNGIVGLDIMRKQHVDLVLLDILMPYFDGLETLQEIRADATISGVPVMMLTASGNKRNVRQALELGVRDYIMKPLLPDDLAERVKKKLEDIDKSIERVLIIGNDAKELAEMKKVVEENFPHEVLTAATVDDAIKILREYNIILVITCADMQFIDGFKVLKFMAANEKFFAMPLAVMGVDELVEMSDKLKTLTAEDLSFANRTIYRPAKKVEVEPEPEITVAREDKKRLINVVTNLTGRDWDLSG